MAKRGYKLQEFVAHSSNVNCLSIGKKACRLFLTGGDDNKVNIWSIGKPNSLMSLCGHTSPVESVAFDSTEVLVLGGASSGVIKLWDLEVAKMVRGLTGHRSNCTAVEFHPFGEFFASGSTDTNLKIWDIRKKGCIHTYKGHARGIGTIKFTPDGRWVVSGGCDGVVKVWDLTAGKLLNDFKFHENHIRSIHFHPLEFLMATGSADRTVKYWDLETFELIGSSRPEDSSVRAITFHPDGRTLFCGLEDSLKVYSWEPIVCHDTVDMGWSSLGDLCIHEGKLVGCSYYQNSVGVWAADTMLIEPFAKGSTAHQVDLPVIHSPAKAESGGLCVSPNYEAKEIKNIYIDTFDGKPVLLHRAGSVNSSQVLIPPDLKDNRNLAAESPRQGPGKTSPEKSNGHSKSLVVPNFVTPDGSDERDTPHSRKDSVSFSRTKPGMLLRPAPSRRPSGPKYSIDRLTVPTESPDIIGANSLSDCHLELNSESRDTLENAVGLSSEGRLNNMKTVSRTMPPVEIANAEKESAITTQDARRESSKEKIPNLTNISGTVTPVKMTKVEKADEPVAQSGESDSVKIVRGVTVMTGRTRTLVEKFEKRERLSIVEEEGVNVSSTLTPTVDSSPASRVDAVERKGNSISHENHGVNVSSSAPTTLSPLTPTMDSTPASRVDAVKRKENSISHESHGVSVSSKSSTTLDRTAVAAAPLAESLRRRDEPTTDNSPTSQVDVVERKGNSSSTEGRGLSIPSSTSTTTEMAPVTTVSLADSYKRRGRSTIKVQSIVVVPDVPRVTPSSSEKLVHEIKVMEEREPACGGNRPNIMPRNAYIESVQSNESQVSGRMESNSETFTDVIEVLMQSHEVFLSTLRSRLTKLQAVRHFWERKDMKGAVNALKRLPDHSVQADVVSVLTEKMEILNLDLFSCLLPVLVGLLDSKIERHSVLSMEMLMKLVAVFGPVVRSTISARPTVDIDLHGEERLECCNQCWAQLQKTQKILPSLVRRGGLLAKGALELNLVLQQL